MKKLFLFLTVATIAISASAKKHHPKKDIFDWKITNVHLSQSPISYDVAHLTDNKPTPIYDTLYTIEPSWSWAIRQQKTGYKILTAIGALSTASALPASYFIASVGGSGAWFLAFSAVGFYIVGEDLEWYKWNSALDIPASEYRRLKARDGNEKEFIVAHSGTKLKYQVQ